MTSSRQSPTCVPSAGFSASSGTPTHPGAQRPSVHRRAEEKRIDFMSLSRVRRRIEPPLGGDPGKVFDLAVRERILHRVERAASRAAEARVVEHADLRALERASSGWGEVRNDAGLE